MKLPVTLTRSFPRGSLLLVLAALGLPAPVRANERHFTYTYESAVLPKNARELEVSSTARTGRKAFYVQFDERVELEVGVTDRLLTAFYLNFNARNEQVAPDVREHEVEFDGVSSEWKLKLGDPVADALGVALYGELSAGPNDSELETKLILDKKAGRWMLAANLVGAQEWSYDESPTVSTQEAEVLLGATYFCRPALSLGLEMRNHNEFHAGDWEHSALFAGPVVAYAADGWWAALTVLPQLPALHKEDGEEGGDSRVLDELEKLDARLIVSLHF